MVDDDAGNRDVLARRLAREGYEVRVAPDGEAALAALSGGSGSPVDLALLDVMMPGWTATRCSGACGPTPRCATSRWS